MNDDGETPLIEQSSSIYVSDNYLPTRRTSHSHKTPLGHLNKFFRSLPMQIIMVLVTFVDLAFLLYEFTSGITKFEIITLCTSLSFFVELLVQVGFEGKDFFLFDKYWLYAEIVIVSLSFFVEYGEFIIHHNIPPNDVTGAIRYLRAIRFFRVAILWKTRVRRFSIALRRIVSADRRRYQAGGFDLDLTYVYNNVIAMSWPSEGQEALYRNHIDNVAKFLDLTHPNSYQVYNLCSERGYDESKFHHRVKRYKMDDHNPAELDMLMKFAKDVTSFIAENPLNNVAVIHCKGGKGRTGTMTCAYLLFAGLHKTAEGAMQHFGSARTSDEAKKFQGVESPSQDRYVTYFDRLLHLPGQVVQPRKVRIASFMIYKLPQMFWNVSKLWFVIVTKPNSEPRGLHYVSNPTVTFSPNVREKNAQMMSSPKESKIRSGSSLSPSNNSSPNLDSPTGEDGGCQGFSGNMMIYLQGNKEAPMSCEDFTAQYGQPQDAQKYRDLDVTVDINTSSIRPFDGDTVIKFFYDVDNPNTLNSPCQFWFHPSLEGDSVKYGKEKLDGPHKEKSKKNKKWPTKFCMELKLETIREEESETTLSSTRRTAAETD